MADDIDVLGQSLLNRQRTTRKRSQRQNKRQRNVELGLTLLNKGAGYANTYLKNRADTFVNEQEDIMGARVRQQKAITQSQATITDMEAAQAYATGPEGWLAQEKFAPILAANVERDYNTNKYSPVEIENLIYDEAAKQAKTYFPVFQQSYDAAMKMGNIDDYDAYVQTRDGRAENVGGFLFNKISRSLNDRTQEDIDDAAIQAIRNNRFTNKADAVLAFDAVLKKGYSLEDAKNLSSEVDFLAGVNPPRIITTVTGEVTKQISEGRRKYDVPLIETTTLDERNNKITTYSQTYTENDEGIITYTNGDLYEKWAGSRQGVSAPPETTPTTAALNPVDIPAMVKAGDAEYGTISAGTIVSEEWPLIQDFRIQQQEVLLKQPGLANEVVIATIEVRTPIKGSLATTGISAVPKGALDSYTVDLKTIANNVRTIGGNTLTQDQLFTMVATGGHNKSIREFDKQDVKGIAVLKDIDNAMAQTAGDAYLFKLNKMTNNPLFAGEKQGDLETLALTTQLMPHLTGLGKDADSYQISSEAIRPEEFPNSSMIIAEQHLSDSYNGQWDGLEVKLYESLVTQSFQELRDELSSDTNELSLKGNALAGQFMRIDQVKNTTIELTELPETLSRIIETSRPSLIVDGTATIETIITTLQGARDEVERKEAAQPPFSDPGDLSLTKMSENLAAQTAPSPAMQGLHDKIVDYLTTRNPLRGAFTRPEVSTTSNEDWQDALTTLTPEQRAEYNKLLEEARLAAALPTATEEEKRVAEEDNAAFLEQMQIETEQDQRYADAALPK